MIDPIRACPFCGESSLVEVKKLEETYYVSCVNCGARGPNKLDVEVAVMLWNEIPRADKIDVSSAKCPFCGKTGDLIFNYFGIAGIPFLKVECHNCGVSARHFRNEILMPETLAWRAWLELAQLKNNA